MIIIAESLDSWYIPDNPHYIMVALTNRSKFIKKEVIFLYYKFPLGSMYSGIRVFRLKLFNF